jgi:hypothetical protein
VTGLIDPHSARSDSVVTDVARLLEVFVRIELRRQLRLRELQEREAS